MRLLVKVLQAVLIVLSLMMMIFLVLDGFNPTMNFLRNGITKGLCGRTPCWRWRMGSWSWDP